MGLKNLVLALFVLACGGSPTGSSSDGSLDCRVNCSYDGGNNKKDGNVSSDVCCNYDVNNNLDGGKDNNTNGNNPPSIELVYENNHPLAGTPYIERNVRKERDTTYAALVSDLDNDSLECRFEFSDGYTRDWNSNCGVDHIINSNGEYNLTARVRDSEGLEGNPYVASLHVMNNIPPVANAGPDMTIEKGVYCLVYEQCPENNTCYDGPYAPGHSSTPILNFDEDGFIPGVTYDEDGFPIDSGYQIFPYCDDAQLDQECDFRYFGGCGPATYIHEGSYTLKLKIKDNEEAESFDEAIVTVTP